MRISSSMRRKGGGALLFPSWSRPTAEDALDDLLDLDMLDMALTSFFFFFIVFSTTLIYNPSDFLASLVLLCGLSSGS
jgi:hypothetical protein